MSGPITRNYHVTLAVYLFILVSEGLSDPVSRRPDEFEPLSNSGSGKDDLEETCLLEGSKSILRGTARQAAPPASKPFVVPLRRESVPIHRDGKIISHKTSYSGEMNLGSGASAQSFRVVFDTGSGHVIVPSADCHTKTCEMHRRYNISQSTTAVAINADGSEVPPQEPCDQITIGFGTGQVVGEIVREKVCMGSGDSPGPCTEINAIMAVDMTPQPFQSFKFDGIIGLGLGSLSLSEDFSFFGLLSKATAGKGSAIAKPHFGVYLSEDEEGDHSEIAFGGHSSSRLASPLVWAPVPQASVGYWQVEVLGVKVGGKLLDICRGTAGPCRGIVDTGTSHLGVPHDHYASLLAMLSQKAGTTVNCHLVTGPTLEILITGGYSLELEPQNYMRKLPNDGSLGSRVVGQATDSTGNPEMLKTQANGNGDLMCKPRLMPVKLPEPMGANNVFIFGEPVLQRYYTVYDWAGPSVGFGLAASRQNLAMTTRIPQDIAIDPDDVPVFLAQTSLTVTSRNGASHLGRREARRFRGRKPIQVGGAALVPTHSSSIPPEASALHSSDAKLATLLGAKWTPGIWDM